MKKTLIGCFLIAALSLAAHAQVDPKVAAQCKDAKDFVGCVKAFTTPATDPDDGLSGLRAAMKQVASRLRSGTSLRDASETFRPVVDQLAITEADNPNSLAVQKAKLASSMFNALQLAWETRIKTSSTLYGETFYNCEALIKTVELYNSIPGAPPVSFGMEKKGLFGARFCRVRAGQLPENYIYANVVRVLSEGSISPAEIATQEKAEQETRAKAQRERELAALEPWNRYLEENPSTKKWAEANPEAAEAEKMKFLKRQSLQPLRPQSERDFTRGANPDL
jgi:hypothetical protein